MTGIELQEEMPEWDFKDEDEFNKWLRASYRTISNKKYSEKNREKRRKYLKEYNRTDATKEARAKWEKNNKDEVRKKRSRYRKRGHIELMKNPFPKEINIAYHHIYPHLPFVMPLPEQTHGYVAGSTKNAKHFRFCKNWINKLYQIEPNELFFPTDNRTSNQQILDVFSHF